MIDKIELNKKIREKANFLLKDPHLMSETELQNKLRYFSEDAKDIAERILEEYIFSVFDKYTEGSSAISDSILLAQFVDLKTGYQQQMLDWIQEHPLNVKEEYFELPELPNEKTVKSDISPKLILGIGTVVAVGLFVFTNIWIALAAEILAIVIMKNRINKTTKRRADELDIKRNHYEIAIKAKINQLINGIIEDLEKWIDLGEVMSNEILLNFKL